MGKDKRIRVNFRGHRRLLIAVALAAIFAATGMAQIIASPEESVTPCTSPTVRASSRTAVLPYSTGYPVSPPASGVDTFYTWEGGAAYFANWPLGPRCDIDYFYIGTWDQSPWNAGPFKGIGFTNWTALYDGTVEIDPGDGPLLPLLRAYNIPTFGDQASGLQTVGTDPMTGVSYAAEAAEHLIDPIIVGWIQEDEPDNAQGPVNGSYVDCVPPSPAYYYPTCPGGCSSADTGAPGTIPGPSITTLYAQFESADPNRPVYLGLGQGTGYPNTGTDYNGRGSPCATTSIGRGLNDYPVYQLGGDILDADDYPENDAHPIWWLGRKADRFRFWSGYGKAVYDDLEMNNIDDVGSVSVTPAVIDGEFWEDVVHGVHGVVWFTHQFSPVFEEASAFAPEHAAAEAQMAADDIQVLALARVLNQPSVSNGMLSAVTSSNTYAGINYLMKRYGGFTFLLTTNDGLPQQDQSGSPTDPSYPITELSAFCHGNTRCTNSTAANAGALSPLPAGGTTATFSLAGFPSGTVTATVLGENIQVSNLPTIATQAEVAPYVPDPSDYVTVCGGSFYYDSCGGGVGGLNPDGTFAFPATPYYFAPIVGTLPPSWTDLGNPIVYTQETAVGTYRTIPVVNGVFTDTFATSYARHLYQINFDPNPGAPLIGDLNGDGVVNEADYQIWLAALGTTAGAPGYDPRADVLRDGTVNTADLAAMPTPPSLTSGTACNGVFSGTFGGNVTVSEGQNCYFAAGARVAGNLKQTGGNLVLVAGTSVGGNLQISGGTFSIMGTIDGNLQIQDTTGTAQNQICGATVQGNLQFQSNATGVQIGSTSSSCAGNTIDGNLQVQNNTGSTVVSDNTVKGNLQDQNNTAPTQVFNNTVNGNLQCSNDSSITGGGNTVSGNKQGQCATF